MRAQQVPQQTSSLRQSLFASEKMEQAFHVLKLPLAELAPFLTTQMNQNPFLDEVENLGAVEQLEKFKPLNFTEEDFSFVAPFDVFLEPDDPPPLDDEKIANPDTLQHHLLMQAEEEFDKEEENLAALFLIGSLEDDGLLITPLEEIASLSFIPLEVFTNILPVLKEFDPPGVFCQSVQEALLRKLEKDTLPYDIVKESYPLFLERDYDALIKRFKCSKDVLLHALAEIKRHRLGAEKCFSPAPPPPVIADLVFEGRNVIVEDGGLPRLELKEPHFEHLTKEDKSYIREKIQEGRWLLRNLEIRKQTLKKIGEAILHFQNAFFFHRDGTLIPLSYQTVAERVGLHPSTVARAVQHKWVTSWRGTFPMESFFPEKMQNSNVSSEAVKDGMIRLIAQESKSKPFSDEELYRKLAERGFPCSRRVIAKYRSILGIPSSHKRKAKAG
jgi:RNA polymerase sigma-54 factor